jgi:3-methyladenine DNA glycosylase AlkC
MSKIIDLVLGFIAYLCVATVITAALLIGYFWHTDQLNSEKVFRMVALLQDVDLHQLAADQKKSSDEVPPEEPSLNEVVHRQQVQDRNYEVKLLALKSGKQEYDESFRKLKEKIDRYDQMVASTEDRLKQQQDKTKQQNVAKVVSQLEQVKPDVGKDLLMKWLDEDHMDEAILLMNRMSENKLKNILKTFQTDKELSKLHEIHRRIMSGGPEATKLEKALGDLNAIDGNK